MKTGDAVNVIRFIKNWTLPISMCTGITVYLLFAFVPALDGMGTILAPFFNRILPLFMFLILFVMFCKVDFRRLRPVKWHFWVGVSQIIFVLTTIGLAFGLHLTGNDLLLAEALLASIACPCASAAAVVTQKLGGNLEEMTTYTFISNFITAVLIPSCFPLIHQSADAGFIAAFLKILYEVCIVLLTPMLFAYIVKHRMTRFHRWIIGVKDLSYYLWGCLLMIVMGTTARNIVHADTTISFLLVIASGSFVLCLIQFGVGRYIGSHFCSTTNAGQALGQKNTAFAIWIANAYLSPLSSVGPGCYILWQNLVNAIEIRHYQYRVETRKD